MPWRLRSAKRSLTDDALDRLIAAEQDERRRIALFLHDGPVQNLSGIALMLDAAMHAVSTGKLEEAESVLGSALERQRATIRELRDLSFALEPVVLRDQGFGPALRALAEQVGTANQVRLDLDIADADQAGETAQVALYTIVRELLDQAIRRGPPTRIEVTMRSAPDGGIETRVTDDAKAERRRRSFEAIEERVKQLHGKIDVDVEDSGTSVLVTLPPYATRR
jgi:two-component system NarL family sensor kinase